MQKHQYKSQRCISYGDFRLACMRDKVWNIRAHDVIVQCIYSLTRCYPVDASKAAVQ